MELVVHKNRKQRVSGSIGYSLLGMVLITASPMTIADDYTDALREEASDLEYLDETRPSNAVSTREQNISPAIKKAMQSINNFENYYRIQDSAGAAIYFRLTTQERLRIYHRFKSTRNFEVARKMTIEIFNKK